jgi:hypothetical protein
MPERHSTLLEGQEVSVAHPLKGFWLFYKLPHRTGSKPFRSVMSLTDRSAATIIIATSGEKFDGVYLQERGEVEAWLRREGEAKGLSVNTNNPIYFYLYRQPLRVPLFGNIIINIPAIALPADKMTFTCDDSFHNYAVLNGRLHATTPGNVNPRVFTAAEISQNFYSNNFSNDFNGSNPDRYIECQVWTHELPIFDRVTDALAANWSQLNEIDILTFT